MGAAEGSRWDEQGGGAERCCLEENGAGRTHLRALRPQICSGRAQGAGAPPDSPKPPAQAERAPRKGGGPCRKDPRVTTPLYSRA